MDEMLSKAVKEAFVRMHADGLVYRDNRLVNWCCRLKTAISDIEVDYVDLEGSKEMSVPGQDGKVEFGSIWSFAYPIEGGGEIVVATTRPETMLGDTAVAVHPDDARYKDVQGKHVIHPFNGRKIPIICDAELVDMSFGTGAVKITPAHDPNDFQTGKRHNLEFINMLTEEGMINDEGGDRFKGMKRFAARPAVIAALDELGLYRGKADNPMRLGLCSRSKDVIEPMLKPQWWVACDKMAAEACDAARSKELEILPNFMEPTWFRWLENIRDWCISRQLWWGHRIPVWYVHESQAALDAARSGTGKGSSPTYVVARDEAEATAKAKAAHGEHVVLYQEEDVLDTWFSSGLWPFSTLGWPNEEAADLAKFFPTQVMETGHDILFFWVARMVMMSYGMTGKLPFHTVFLHGLVRDEKGRKMSKSLGNVVDPLNVIDEQGCDALRFTLATGTAAGQDLNLNMDRLASNRNFTNKIWNSGKFVLYSLEGMSDDERVELVDAAAAVPASLATLPLAERWIVSRLHAVVDHVTSAHDRYDFGEAGRAAYSFFYDDFADWFIEGAKSRLYGDDPAAAKTTKAVSLYVLDNTLRVLHPFVPYVTEEVWRSLPHRGDSIMNQSWPRLDAERDAGAVGAFETVQGIVRSIRNARAEYAVEPAKRIPAFVVISDAALMEEVAAELAMVGGLARLDADASRVCAAAPADAVETPGDFVQTVVSDGVEVYLPLSGIVDPAKELARLGKQAGKLEKEAEGLAGRLKSPKFVEKAPAEVVEKSKKELAELEEQLASVRSRMSQMEALAAK
mmetsp:Transcript_7695/g.30397  ORF Transcript_7695/g.30397 Transcript_7695/m.30397 type:complete len:795 (-) Transcript_7695:1421-3805(-)